jgi:hypothetical protein
MIESTCPAGSQMGRSRADFYYWRYTKMNRTMTKFSVVIVGLLLLIAVGCQPQEKVPPAAKTEAAPAPVIVADKVEPAAPSAVTKTAAKPAEEKPAAAPVEPAPQATGKGPELTFETKMHDFGDVGPGTKHTFVYKFKNIGEDVLKITNINAPCGCTVPVLEKREYAPGESGEIAVTYTALATKLPVTKHVYISSNDKKNPEYEISLKAVSVPKVSVEPENFELNLRKENAGMGTITLKSTDGKAFSIKAFGAMGGCMTADFDPNAEATSFTLSPKVDMDKLRMSLSGPITIELTHPESTMVEAHYMAKADYETQPAVFYLQAAEPEKAERKELWVISNYDTGFEIESITSEKGSMKVASQEKQGNKYHVMVDITPPASAKTTRFFLDNLLVKIKDGPTLKVRCNAWLKQTPASGASR